MTLNTMIDDLGDDADLLTRSDEWLEMERQSTATEIDKLANELRAILLAQRIKRQLQQHNLVAVQHLLRSDDGRINDILIRIMNLADALESLEPARDSIDHMNAVAQRHGWHRDGYDLQTSASLR